MLQSLRIGNSGEKGRRWSRVAIPAIAVLTLGGGFSLWRSQVGQPTPAATVAPAPQIKTVTALGRLEPQGEVVKLSAPTSNNGNRVEQLLVQAGDRVQAGQVIAILDSRDTLQAAYAQAQEDVRVAEARLATIQAGAKQGEIAAQQAEIERLTAQRQGDIQAQAATVARLAAEVQNAETELNRYQSLYQDGAIAAVELDRRRLSVDTTRRSLEEAQAVLARIQSTTPAQLNQARATLTRIAEVRPVDVATSRAEVQRAIAAKNRAQAELAKAYVRSPLAGEVLDIHAQAGEVVGADGIADIGKTQRMYAVAQVYESDIRNVKVGRSVQVTSDSLPSTLTGKVERIESQVRRQTVVNTDPSTNIDGRVVEVYVALDPASSQRAAKFTNLQVTVEISQ